MSFRAGAWVEVRSKEEILRTLDDRGRLDNLPFMPQMFDFCGRRFRVYKRAHKTCDTVNWTGSRRLPGGIHLEDLRCDGQAYGGCQAACLLFWNEAWLKPVDGARQSSEPKAPSAGPKASGGTCSEAAVQAGTLAADQPETGGPRYSCQATELPTFTTRIPWWDFRQYIEDYTSGNVPLTRLVSGAVYALYYSMSQPGRRFGEPLRSLYDMFQRIWGGVPYPRRTGTIPTDQAVPRVVLDLQPGELVRVKSYESILATVDTDNRNRGLMFDAEMVPFCGHMFRVKSRVTRFVNEKTGLIIRPRGAAVILERVWCGSRYSSCRMLCPRSIYAWWREIWLERVEEKAAPPSAKAQAEVGAGRYTTLSSL
jgi:hypothetical protein